MEELEQHLELIPVKSKEQEIMFALLKKEMIHYHKEFADKKGIIDTQTLKYTEKDSLKHLDDETYFLYLIQFRGKIVGILEYVNSLSKIKDEPIVFLNSIYIINEYQGMGIGRHIIKYLKTEFGTVELELYYDIPAKYLYEELGFKVIYSRLVLE